MSGTNFPCSLNPSVFGIDSSKLSHAPKIALWTVTVPSGWLQLFCTVRQSISSWTGKRNVGLLQDSEKKWGALLSLVAPWWTCLMAIRSCSRQTWECAFLQRLGPHWKWVLTWTCVLTLFSLAGLVPESQTCFYIYQNFWSPLGTAILCQWSHVLLVPLTVLYCQLLALPADTLLRPAVERMGSHPHPPAGSPALITSPAFSSDCPLQYFYYSSSSLFLPIFIWNHLPVSSSLLCWNDIFSFLSSSLYLQFSPPFLRFSFQPSGSHVSSAASFIALLYKLLHLSFLPINTYLTVLCCSWFPGLLYPGIFCTGMRGGEGWGRINQNHCTWVQMPLQVQGLRGQVIKKWPLISSPNVISKHLLPSLSELLYLLSNRS